MLILTCFCIVFFSEVFQRGGSCRDLCIIKQVEKMFDQTVIELLLELFVNYKFNREEMIRIIGTRLLRDQKYVRELYDFHQNVHIKLLYEIKYWLKTCLAGKPLIPPCIK